MVFEVSTQEETEVLPVITLTRTEDTLERLVYIYFNTDEEPAFICMFCDWDIDEGDRKDLEFFNWAKQHNLMHRKEFDALGEKGIDPVQRCYLIWHRHRGVRENEE